MAKKKFSLKQFQATKLTKEQELNTKGGYITYSDKFKWTNAQTSKSDFIIEDEVDIRRPYKSDNLMNG